MDGYYTNCIEKTVDYIRKNLDKKISLAAVAEASGISKFHFHRIFQAYTGEPVFKTVIRLRAENAASMLLETSKTVSEIAGISGFGNSREFGKIFRDMFGASPSAWREKNKDKKPENSVQHTPLESIQPERDEVRTTEISRQVKTLDDFSIVYIRHTGAYAGDTALFIYLYNKLTTWAASKDLLSPERHNIVVYHYPVWITEEPKIKISLGISVPEDVKTNGDIGKMKIPGGEYLIVRHSLRDEEFEEAWNRAYREVLPELGLLPANGFSFELYPVDEKSPDRYASIVDICIPVINPAS